MCVSTALQARIDGAAQSGVDEVSMSTAITKLEAARKAQTAAIKLKKAMAPASLKCAREARTDRTRTEDAGANVPGQVRARTSHPLVVYTFCRTRRMRTRTH
jgi:hypothetical protein